MTYSIQTKPPPQVINTIIEPSVIAIGPIHLSVALNNRALFWDLSSGQYSISIHFERDYLATVESMCLNETYASILFDGKLQLHLVRTRFEIRIFVGCL